MTALPSVGPLLVAGDLSQRLDALAGLAAIGRSRAGGDGFATSLLDDTDELLRRAGERLRLSGSHTVVALAGGTGSGKSTLFNALAGATFSPPGVIRPTTRNVHACVWGIRGARPLLDWLDVPRRDRYARASALDSGEAVLRGLVLLDLPDHDSVVTTSMSAVDRISKLADMLIWVLDPQKYADAALHNRYLIPLAGHAGVFTVVLNQIDVLTPEQAADCEDDLRRLLDSEGLTETPLLPVSARTGQGLDQLRALLAQAVSDSNAARERIAADIDSLLGGYAIHASGEPAPVLFSAPVPVDEEEEAAPEPEYPPKPSWEVTPEELAEFRAEQGKPPWEDARPAGAKPAVDWAANIPEGPAQDLATAFAGAVGLSAVAEGLASAREAQAAAFTGWPLARLGQAAAFTGWPLARLRHGRRGRPVSGDRAASGERVASEDRAASEERAASRDRAATGDGAGGVAGKPHGQAQQSEVDNAITVFADAAGGELPAPWPASVRAAARSHAAEVPSALAAAVSEVLPGKPKAPVWWLLIVMWQWLLAVLAVGTLAWAILIGVVHGGGGGPALLSDLSLIPWLVVMAGAMLLLGWLTAAGCQNMTLIAADRERERAEQAMSDQVTSVARDLVLTPAGRELAEYELFRRQLATAQAPRAT